MSEPTTVDMELWKLVLGAVLGLFGVAGGTMALVKKNSDLSVSTAENEGEISTMARAMARVQYLEAELEKTAIQRNEAVSAMGGLTTEIRFLREQQVRFNEETNSRAREVQDALHSRQRTAAQATERIESKLDEVKSIAAEAAQTASHAYREANNFNTKLAKVVEIDPPKPAGDKPKDGE